MKSGMGEAGCAGIDLFCTIHFATIQSDDSFSDHPPSASHDYGNVADSLAAEHAAIALDFGWRAQCLRVVVGEFHRRPAFNRGYLADQADGVQVAAVGGIAAAKIIGQKSSPACAETNAPAWGPLLRIVEIRGGAKVIRRDAACQRPAKIGVQSQNVIDIERV